MTDWHDNRLKKQQMIGPRKRKSSLQALLILRTLKHVVSPLYYPSSSSQSIWTNGLPSLPLNYKGLTTLVVVLSRFSGIPVDSSDPHLVV